MLQKDSRCKGISVFFWICFPFSPSLSLYLSSYILFPYSVLFWFHHHFNFNFYLFFFLSCYPSSLYPPFSSICYSPLLSQLSISSSSSFALSSFLPCFSAFFPPSLIRFLSPTPTPSLLSLPPSSFCKSADPTRRCKTKQESGLYGRFEKGNQLSFYFTNLLNKGRGRENGEKRAREGEGY